MHHEHKLADLDGTENQHSAGVSEGSSQGLSGKYVFINQVPFKVNGTLDEVLNKELRNFEGKTVLVELNTVEYTVEKPIMLPSKIQSRVIVKGNHATIKSSIPEEDYVFTKLGDFAHDLTGIADTYQDIRDLTISGSGGGVFLQGGFQSKVINVRTRSLSRGIYWEFILQGQIEDCHIVWPSDFGIKLRVVKNTNVNSSQCNQSSITNCRIVAKNTDTGIFVSNSNNVSLVGNIVEGGAINKGIHLHNVASTVISCYLKRTHFECSSYGEACVFISGKWGNVLVDEMYYSGKNGLAFKTKPKKGINLTIENTWLRGWTNCLFEEPKEWPVGRMAKGTKWYIKTKGMDSIEQLFTGEIKPYYVYHNNTKLSLKPSLLPID